MQLQKKLSLNLLSYIKNQNTYTVHNKITSILLLVLSVIMVSIILTGCGKSTSLQNTNTGNEDVNASVNNSSNASSTNEFASNDNSAAFDDTLTQTESKNAETIAMKINNTNIYVDEALYFIAYYEAYGQTAAENYEYYYQTSDYWDLEQDESGITARDIYKTNAYTSLYYYNVLSIQAEKEGYSLTDEEYNKIDSMLINFFDDYSADELALSGMNSEGIRKALEKLVLAGDYSDAILDSISIDEDAIRNQFDNTEYRQIETEYLFLPTQTYDDNQIAITPTAEETKAYLSIMQEALAMAQEGTSFEDIKAFYADDVSFTSTKRNYLAESTDVEEAYKSAVSLLDNNELSGIVKGNYGYYIIRMLNTSSDSAYEEAVANAINNARTDAFNEAYNKISDEYKMELNEEYWNTLKMGNTTIIADTSVDNSSSIIDNSLDTDVIIGN